MIKKHIYFVSWSAPFFSKYFASLTSNRIGCMTRLCGPKSGGIGSAPGYERAFVVGMYHPSHSRWPKIKCSKGVLLFAGAELKELEGMDKYVRDNLFRKMKKRNIIFATESPIIRKRVQKNLGLDTVVIYIPSPHIFPDKPDPMPKKFSVGCYIYRKDYYNIRLIREVVRDMSDVVFYFYSLNGYVPSKEDRKIPNLICCEKPITNMPKFLSKISCGLRITVDDTYSMSAIEYNLAGRWFINNHNMPHCLRLPLNTNLDEVVEAIKRARKLSKSRNVKGRRYYNRLHNVGVFKKTLKTLFLG